MPNEPAKDAKEIVVNGATIMPAVKRAVREALERHRQAGVPVVLWEDGKTVWRDAGEVLAELDAKTSEASETE